MNKDEKLLYQDESFLIRGAIIEVYKHLGAGFLESVYQEGLERELALQGIPFESQPQLQIQYKGDPLAHTFQPDFVCFGKIIVELKSVKALLPEHEAQLINYLRASGMRLGFLVNFSNVPQAKIKRFVR
ncbi:GxxExxY protein [bacterium]|nr:GxxExxY protein [bacterium]